MATEDTDEMNDMLGLVGEDGEVVRLHAVLSNDEVLEARARARAKIEKERRAAAMKAVEAEETTRLRLEEGLVTGVSENDEPVSITLDLAPHSDCIRTNGVEGSVYWHGFTYTVPRHVANSLREIQARGWIHQDEIDGKNLTQHYQNKRVTVLSPIRGTINAPARPN